MLSFPSFPTAIKQPLQDMTNPSTSFLSDHRYQQSIRIRLTLSLSSLTRKCWFEIPQNDTGCDTIAKLISRIKTSFDIKKSVHLELELDGFLLLESSSIFVVRDGDLLEVKEKKMVPVKKTKEAVSSSEESSSSSESSTSDSSEESESSNDSTSPEEDEEPEKSSTNIPLSLGRHKMNLVKKMQNIAPKHVRFDTPAKKSLPPPVIEKATQKKKAEDVPPAKAMFTSVYLYDDFRGKVHPDNRIKQPNLPSSSQTNQPQQKKTKKVRLDVPEENVPTAEETRHEEDNALSTNSTNHKDEEDILTSVPHITGTPVIGDRIAFKMIEMSESYAPTLSRFKKGTVMAYDSRSTITVVQLDPEYIKPAVDGEETRGRFDLVDAEEFMMDNTSSELNGIITMELVNFLEMKRLA